MAISDTIMKALVSNAVKAASGDNVQPWRFVIDINSAAISIHLDPTRDPSPINAGQRMSRIACGAAMENLMRTARRMGYGIQHVPPTDDALAKIIITNNQEANPAATQPDLVLSQRCTNRRFYNKRPVTESIVKALRATCIQRHGVKTHFLVEAKKRLRCGRVDARGTSLMYLQPSIRKTMSSNIHFKRRNNNKKSPTDGIPRASLEISAIECLALRLMFKSPNWLLRYGGSLKAMEWHFRRLHRSASGLCLITAPDNSEQTDVLVGQAMQRAWLAMTEHGLAAQPMMSVLVLDGIRTLGESTLAKAIGHERIRALISEMKTCFGLNKLERPAFLLRFGYAAPPSGRSGRRPLSDVVQSSRMTKLKNTAVPKSLTRSPKKSTTKVSTVEKPLPPRIIGAIKAYKRL